ncbi:hypothetical protein M9Y10_042607 [Tritrichomonas musculus]|uniref:SCP domain-containing protein n=1 Tax=Tritrichomonas musculus TaxID=1915356 RepID=A0ABR2JXC3_9EUKA
MSSKTSKKTTSQTVTKNGKTIKTQTTIETSADPSGRITTKKTIIETIKNKDGSTSTTTKTTTETSKGKTSAQTLRPTSKIDSDDFFNKEFEKMKLKMDSNARKVKTEMPKEKPRALLENNEKKNSFEFWKITNEFRKKNGKSPLKLDDSISEIAKEHNDLMLAGKRGLGHEGFHERSKRIKNSVAAAENVCYCSDQPDPLNVLFNSLANHPPHRVNILGDYNSIGISVAKNSRGQWFVSQLFAQLK